MSVEDLVYALGGPALHMTYAAFDSSSSKEDIRSAFLKEARRVGLNTARLVSIFSDADLEIRPVAGSRSTREIIQHIGEGYRFSGALLGSEMPTKEHFTATGSYTTVIECIESLSFGLRQVQSIAKSGTAERLWEKVQPFGNWSGSRLSLAVQMLQHEVHHQGQLTVYARIAGLTPPTCYDAVSKELEEKVFGPAQ